MQAKNAVMISLALGMLIAIGCGGPQVAPFDLTEVATDKTYGYSQHLPVKVGGAVEGRKARHREAFFRTLRGPQGQPVSYVSQGTCCSFDLGAGGTSRGDLEVFLVTYPRIPKPVILYLDYYRFEFPKAPAGFTFSPPSPEPASPAR